MKIELYENFGGLQYIIWRSMNHLLIIFLKIKNTWKVSRVPQGLEVGKNTPFSLFLRILLCLKYLQLHVNSFWKFRLIWILVANSLWVKEYTIFLHLITAWYDCEIQLMIIHYLILNKYFFYPSFFLAKVNFVIWCTCSWYSPVNQRVDHRTVPLISKCWRQYILL